MLDNSKDQEKDWTKSDTTSDCDQGNLCQQVDESAYCPGTGGVVNTANS